MLKNYERPLPRSSTNLLSFFDVRDAAKALKALDGTEIHGKRVKIEFSRPGGQAHKARVQLQQRAQGSSVYNSIASSLPSLAGAGPVAVAGQPLDRKSVV